jgi:hypothetical protein
MALLTSSSTNQREPDKKKTCQSKRTCIWCFIFINRLLKLYLTLEIAQIPHPLYNFGWKQKCCRRDKSASHLPGLVRRSTKLFRRNRDSGGLLGVGLVQCLQGKFYSGIATSQPFWVLCWNRVMVNHWMSGQNTECPVKFLPCRSFWPVTFGKRIN